MKATINGEQREFGGHPTFLELLKQLGVAQSGIAVARNDKVVPGSKLSLEFIADGDNIEIIRAVAGG